MNKRFHIVHCTWQDYESSIRNIRIRVFVEEQKVPLELEWEGNDDQFHYVVAFNTEDEAIGTGRIDGNGHIGRMAVLKNYRGQGVGRALLSELLDYARHNRIIQVELNAQTSAIPFYEKQGFIISSDEFMEAGIPHKTMEKIV